VSDPGIPSSPLFPSFFTPGGMGVGEPPFFSFFLKEVGPDAGPTKNRNYVAGELPPLKLGLVQVMSGSSLPLSFHNSNHKEAASLERCSPLSSFFFSWRREKLEGISEMLLFPPLFPLSRGCCVREMGYRSRYSGGRPPPLSPFFLYSVQEISDKMAASCDEMVEPGVFSFFLFFFKIIT